MCEFFAKLLQPLYLTAVAKFRKVAKLCDKAILRFKEGPVAKVKVKVKKIPYSYIGRQPNHKKVALEVAKMEADGWKLQHRHEYKAGIWGCLIPFAIGRTELTFVREK